MFSRTFSYSYEYLLHTAQRPVMHNQAEGALTDEVRRNNFGLGGRERDKADVCLPNVSDLE